MNAILFLRCGLLFIVFCVSEATAEDSNAKVDAFEGALKREYYSALNNTHHDIVACIVYFQTVYRCTSGSQVKKEQDTSVLYKKLSERMIEYNFFIANQLGLSSEANASRLRIASRDMVYLMKNSCINISSAIERYSDNCKKVYKNPLSRIEKLNK